MAFAAPAAIAALTIIGMPSGTSHKTNAWDSYPYTWPGNTLDLWGRVYSNTGGTGILRAKWNFGDGVSTAYADMANSQPERS